jgi:hypothetical protein
MDYSALGMLIVVGFWALCATITILSEIKTKPPKGNWWDGIHEMD